MTRPDIWHPYCVPGSEDRRMFKASTQFDVLDPACLRVSERYINYSGPYASAMELAGHFQLASVFPDDYICEKWHEAAEKLERQIARTEPDRIVVSGKSGLRLLGAAVPALADGHIAGIPVVWFDSNTLYTHRMADERAEKHEAMLTKMGESLGIWDEHPPRHVLTLDDRIGGAEKAYISYIHMRELGIPRVTVGVLSAFRKNDLVSLVGSTDRDFAGYVINLANAVSFSEDSHGWRALYEAEGTPEPDFYELPGILDQAIGILSEKNIEG
ncbi:hypothetical protein M1555_02090 [Patescibacteria group bacterium]|nr:hypothetical protein [Patescibacteria group bacterium]